MPHPARLTECSAASGASWLRVPGLPLWSLCLPVLALVLVAAAWGRPVSLVLGLALVLPSFTTTTDGPSYSGSQLAFAGISSLALYAVFVFVQPVRLRDYFLPVGIDDKEVHGVPPPNRVAWTSLAMLLLALVGVVGLAKALAPTLESRLVSAITMGSGRATVMHGSIHLVLFAAFLFLTVVP